LKLFVGAYKSFPDSERYWITISLRTKKNQDGTAKLSLTAIHQVLIQDKQRKDREDTEEANGRYNTTGFNDLFVYRKGGKRFDCLRHLDHRCIVYSCNPPSNLGKRICSSCRVCRGDMFVVGKKLMLQVFYANWTKLQRFICQIRTQILPLCLLVLVHRLVFPNFYLGFWEKQVEVKAWHVAEFVALSILLFEAGILLYRVARDFYVKGRDDVEYVM
jgi:hypothetical protein